MRLLCLFPILGLLLMPVVWSTGGGQSEPWKLITSKCRNGMNTMPKEEYNNGKRHILCERHFWGHKSTNWIPLRDGVAYELQNDLKGFQCVSFNSSALIVRCGGDHCDANLGFSEAIHACRVKEEAAGLAVATKIDFNNKTDEGNGKKIGIAVGVPLAVLIVGGLACFALVKCLTREAPNEPMPPLSGPMIPSAVSSVQQSAPSTAPSVKPA
ncbi:hypothetical protein PENTCL1PPCAC_21835 [Pristionchus entomophagus]|uniref:CX domain-containing protein n=1 Tax=Pristionchus entomophagus TaxID=358040 RepID=A0AAV5TZH9_9BILA|nr:hypothetical protein PENTCL1PPCAC_21835 [Pristionchus entomophagus]